MQVFRDCAAAAWLILAAVPSHAQIVSGRDHAIENVATGLMMDVRGGSTEPGAEVGPFELNHTAAQIFQPRVADGVGVLEAAISGLLVTPDIRGPVAEGAQTGPTPTRLVQLSRLGPEQTGRDGGGLVQGGATHQDSGLRPDHQRWRFVQVSGDDVFRIENVGFPRPFAITQVDRSLVMLPVSGDRAQHWRIFPIRPSRVEGLAMREFTWRIVNLASGEIEGELTWDRPGPPAERIVIRMRRSDNPGIVRTIGEVPASRTTFSFERDSRHGKDREHCFLVRAVNEWTQGFESSLCETPNTIDVGGPPDPAGFKALRVENCHMENLTVHLWTRDQAGPDTAWSDHGTLSSGCARTTIELEDGEAVVLKAVDCGDEPPHIVNGSCHRLTQPSILGDEDGAMFFEVRVD